MADRYPARSSGRVVFVGALREAERSLPDPARLHRRRGRAGDPGGGAGGAHAALRRPRSRGARCTASRCSGHADGDVRGLVPQVRGLAPTLVVVAGWSWPLPSDLLVMPRHGSRRLPRLAAAAQPGLCAGQLGPHPRRHPHRQHDGDAGARHRQRRHRRPARDHHRPRGHLCHRLRQGGGQRCADAAGAPARAARGDRPATPPGGPPLRPQASGAHGRHGRHLLRAHLGRGLQLDPRAHASVHRGLHAHVGGAGDAVERRGAARPSDARTARHCPGRRRGRRRRHHEHRRGSAARGPGRGRTTRDSGLLVRAEGPPAGVRVRGGGRRDRCVGAGQGAAARQKDRRRPGAQRTTKRRGRHRESHGSKQRIPAARPAASSGGVAWVGAAEPFLVLRASW